MSASVRRVGLLVSLTMLIGCCAGVAATTVTKVAGGFSHTLFLSSDGSLWGMGANWGGQLGTGTVEPPITRRPIQIVSSNVVSIAAGAEHSLFLMRDGSLWVMGENNYGQLGDGTTNEIVASPERIVASDVQSIACGSFHSLFIKTDGSLWGMGFNSDGQLGNGTTDNAKTPMQIVSSNVVAVSAGDSHTLFLKSDGSLWAMGANSSGQLGNGSFNSTNQPEQIVSSNVTAIAAGDSHTLFLKSDGSLWAMGWNVNGQLGDGTYNYYGTNNPEQIVATGVTAITAGFDHSLFLKCDGSLWGMGLNLNGELGVQDGNVNIPKPIVPAVVTLVTAGAFHTLFIKSDGSLWGMGRDDSGELGDGFLDHAVFPEQIIPLPEPQPVLRVNFWATRGDQVRPPLTITTNLQFRATCLFGGIFYLLSSTNLSSPLNQWTRVSTNSVTTRASDNFNITLTNAVNPNLGKEFFVLRAQ
jgi:alpha-tubulin suppressor-like RCC1 family protein